MSSSAALEAVYVATGLVLWVFAFLVAREHRYAAAAFWFLFGAIFTCGSILPARVSGLLVLAMVAIDAADLVGRGPGSEPSRAQERRSAIFVPVLLIPAVTFTVAVAFRLAGADPNRGALIGLGIGGILAAAAAVWITGSSAVELMKQGQRLNDAMGSVNMLPQLLASLGVIFAAAKAGDLVAAGIQNVLPEGNLFLLAGANCLGMALFTIVMGNSFAAFPVMAAGVLVPLIVKPLGVDASMAGILTLTAGSSGTLMTVMAANFNIVPAALLNMRNPYGVIRFQLPYALVLWASHIVLLWAFLRFRPF